MRSKVSTTGEVFGLDRKRASILLVALVALKIAVLFVLAWHRRFVMDEFVQFGFAKYIPGEVHALALTQVKALGYAFFFKPAHLIGWDARSMLLIGRMEMALLGCATLAIVYATARAMGQTKTRSALAVLVLLSFSNFIERIFETRGDPLSVFFAAVALVVALRGPDGAKRILAAGVLSGFAFLSTQKAVYFNFALGVALVGDAALDRRFLHGIARGAWLVLGWAVPIAIYCLLLGGPDAYEVAHNLFFGPVGIASPQTAAAYGGLRQYVVQTLTINLLLYLLCVFGMAIAAARSWRVQSPHRIALIFTWLVAGLVFAHNQPWPYVFVMALPFMALWATDVFDVLADRRPYLLAAWAILGVAVAASFLRNVQAWRIDNRAQLALVARAETLLGPNDVYFDGVGMLPDRPEPSTLWLDRHAILLTLSEGRQSDAYRIFSRQPPKMILWSYRMDGIEPVVGPLIRNSYVRVAPNIRLAGARLVPGPPVRFNAPIAGTYGLYDGSGNPVDGVVSVNGVPQRIPVQLPKGPAVLALNGPVPEIWTRSERLLLPLGAYRGRIGDGPDDPSLFEHVYD